jgi:LmbE family N-acetylglucosaminyl deacetylase
LKLLAVLAHPDDESLGFGGTLAKYAAEGVETYLVTATRGERGRFGSSKGAVTPAETGRVRETELRDAAAVLGVRELSILGFPDGALEKVDHAVATAAIAAHIRRIQPEVVVTFGPDGAYGHPDHIAIGQFATAATVCAADSAFQCGENLDEPLVPYRVPKFYYMAWRKASLDLYEATFRKLVSTVDGDRREAAPWPDWAVTTELETSAFWRVVWRAVNCHRTQMAIFEHLESLPEEHHSKLWGLQEFYRVYSTVNGGRRLETDLFEGLR